MRTEEAYRYRESRDPERTQEHYSPPQDRYSPTRRTYRNVAPPVEEESESPAAPAWHAVARGAALFAGSITLLHVLGEMRFPQFSVNAWWVDLHPVPKPMARCFLALTGTLLVLFCLFPRINVAARRLATLCTLGLMGAALWNTVRFYQALRGGQLHTDVPLPFSLHVAATAAVVIPGLLTTWERFHFFRDFIVGWSTVAACALGFAVAQFFCIGKTDDRHHAQAILVFVDSQEGGDAREAAAQRIRAACALYQQKLVHKLIVVGPSAEGNDERSAARLAAGQGVAAEDILVDAGGNDLQASVAKAARQVADKNLTGLAVLAPFYEIPRVKLSCQRAGLDVIGIPLQEERRLQDLRPALVREFAALWLCYLQPVLM